MRGWTIPDLFWSKVRVAGPAECWLWLGATNSQGYGRFAIVRGGGRRRLLAHRFAYELATAEDIREWILLHSCDVPRCCNPAHLSPGTRAQNAADCWAKGRHSPPPLHRGEAHHLAKLTEADVIMLRSGWFDGQKRRDIARHLGVSQNVIGQVLRGQTWRHVGESRAG